MRVPSWAGGPTGSRRATAFATASMSSDGRLSKVEGECSTGSGAGEGVPASEMPPSCETSGREGEVSGTSDGGLSVAMACALCCARVALVALAS